MLKRVYIDNFRCFVNFELSLDQQVLVLGLNGTGKSSFLDVLRGVKSVVSGDRKPDDIFPHGSRTRWQSLSQQTFELEVDLDEEYKFQLELEGWGRPEKTRIKKEVVLCNERPVFEFMGENGTARIDALP